MVIRVFVGAVGLLVAASVGVPAFAEDLPIDRPADVFQSGPDMLRSSGDRLTRCMIGYAPSTACSSCPPPGWRGFVDLLYWTSDTKLDYLDLEDQSGGIQTREVALDQFAPGFRVGFGRRFCGAWDVTAGWTHWRGTADDRTTVGQDQVGRPIRLSEEIAPILPGDTAASDLDLQVDLVNLDVGRSFVISKCCVGRVFAGLQWGRIDLESETVYPDASGDAATVSESFDFDGFGLRVGGDLEYHLGCGWSVFGSGAVGGLIGSAESTHEQLDLADRVTLSKDLEPSQVVPMFQAALGVAWARKLGCHCFRVALAYEVLSFQDIELARPAGDPGLGLVVVEDLALTLHGPRLRFQIDF